MVSSSRPLRFKTAADSPPRTWRFIPALVRCNYRIATFLALGLILAVALFLRTYRLSNELVFSDEAFSWRVSSYPLPQLVDSVAGDTAPLAHFLLLKAWLQTVGTSPVQMRSLSVIFGLGTIVMVYFLCRDAIRLRHPTPDTRHLPSAHLGPLFAATLVAIHASQISASRIARMYSQGCFLAAASAWCLLKALYAPRRQAAWWTAYALLAAAALHTHNFALFMVAAQFLYVALVLCRRTAGDGPGSRRGLTPFSHDNPAPREEMLTRTRCLTPSPQAVRFGALNIDRRKTFCHATIAFCLVALLYAPWLPTFLQQAARVKQNFWLPELSVGLLSGTFTTWLTGLRGGDATWFAAVWLAFFLMMIVYTVRQRDELGLFFLLQALLPWFAAVLISILGGRPLLDERYLVFSQVALLTYWGYTCAQLSPLMISLLVAVNLMIPTVAGMYDYLTSIPVRPPSIISAIEFMRHAYQPGDMIIAPDARDLNMFKYYASEAGWQDFDIRCPRVEYEPGHVNHISSLSPNDWLSNRESLDRARMLWVLNQPPAWTLSGQWTETWSRGYAPMDRSWVYGLLVRTYQRSSSQD